ncbi:spore germination protein [Paenibacillus sp. V4I9]|uniref:Ger(x)C family spore germination protein n=1 Tax=Paenibacillus sp. V4I9 TaxID=3042308 RepID=UPI00278757AB|nr:Ger(x)C family spore germination protein [Paenibacillus sp. V4I9]MDQ0889470.1 spore germination protein [Paenibacillus sp. V4I9]
MRGGSSGYSFYKAVIALTSCFIVTSCGSQQVINKIKMVQTAGYDMAGERVKCSIIFANYKEKGKTNLQLIETESDSDFDMIPRLNTKTNKAIQYGQMGMVLYGKNFAEQGLGPVLESFYRDARISGRVQLGVSEMDASEMLAVANKSQETLYLMNMIEQNMKSGNLPQMNFKTHLFNFYGEGRDFFLPYFIFERDDIKIDGLALFKDDKFVTKVGNREAFILKLLTENSRNGSLLMPLKGSKSRPHDYVLMKSVTSKVNYKFISMEPVPSIFIQLKLKVAVKDIPDWLHLSSKEEFSLFEQQLGEYIKEEVDDFISLCKSKKVDPIGFGDFIRSRSKSWNEKDFQSSYPLLKTKIKIDLAIVQSGVGQL